MCAVGEFHSDSSTYNQHVQSLTESWSKMVLAVGDLDVHAKLCVGGVCSNEMLYDKNRNFRTDTEHRKLRRMMVQTSVKKFFSKHMRGDKFQTAYINQMNSSLLQTFLRKNMAH